MLIWSAIALILGLAIFGVLLPLSRRVGVGKSNNDADFYRAQLREIDHDLERRLIDKDAAEEAKTESARRLLAVEAQSTEFQGGAPSLKRRRSAALGSLILIPLIAISLYAKFGSPQMPDQPYAARLAAAENTNDFNSLLTRVEMRLATHPEDGAGWAIIAPVYLSIGRFDDAIKAYANALRLNGETADARAGLGESRVAAADGLVTADASADFAKALNLDPMNDRARFYQAMAVEQDGHPDQATTLYRALLTTLDPSTDAAKMVRARIAALENAGVKKDFDPSNDQSAMIRAMVERLDTRLQGDGSDVEGWVRLMKAYQVLGEATKASDALKRARLAQALNATNLQTLESTAHELGIEN